jgi:hypothetical protein
MDVNIFCAKFCLNPVNGLGNAVQISFCHSSNFSDAVNAEDIELFLT